MRRFIRIPYVMLAIALMFSMLSVVAQSSSFHFVNESNLDLSASSIESAAESLMKNYRAKVAIYVVTSGDATDFSERLVEDEIAVFQGRTPGNVIAIYIATEERYSELRWGSKFDIDGGRIRREALNANLRIEAYETAITETLEAVEADLSNPLRGIGTFLGSICGNPALIVIFGVFLLSYIAHKMGWSSGESSGYSDYSSTSSWSDDSSSSWDSGDSGGGSDGGSWDD